jgi:hypothetical protein
MFVMVGGSASACAGNEDGDDRDQSIHTSNWQEAEDHHGMVEGHPVTQVSWHDGNGYNRGDKHDEEGTDHGSAVDSDELRLELHATLRQHADMGVAALKAELLQEPDRAALMNAVEANTQAVTDAVDMAYPGTKDALLPLWRQHIADYGMYLNGAKANDEAAKMQAREGLEVFAEQASSLLAEQSNRLDQDILKQQLVEHGNQVTTIIDNMVAGKYDEVYQLAHQAYEHMGMMADTLTAGRTRHHNHMIES